MKELVIFNEQGQPVGRAPAPPSNHYLLPAGMPFVDNAGRMLAPDGTYRWMLMGAPCFGGEDGRQAMAVPMDPDLIGVDWAGLAALVSPENPFGLLQAPRPETPEEATAREEAAEEAAAAAIIAARANAVVSAAQFRKALVQIGLYEAVKAVMDDPATPPVVVISWEYETQYRRAWPMWADFLPLVNKTEADLDAVFALAASL